MQAARPWREAATAVQERQTPKDARCHYCGEWASTVPAGTTWVRVRCANRRCRKFQESQTIHLR